MKYTEHLINEPDVERTDCGHTEKVIVQSESELSFSRIMAEWKRWNH